MVISIIALLIALLLPALGAARGAAQATRCMSNVRQIVLGVNVYSLDFRGLYPTASWLGWSNPAWYADAVMGKYLGGRAVWDCPSFVPVFIHDAWLFTAPGDPIERGEVAYLMNNSFWGAAGHAFYWMGEASRHPSEQALVLDRGRRYNDTMLKHDSWANWDNQFPFNRHHGGTSVNVAYFDGHGATERVGQIDERPLEWVFGNFSQSHISARKFNQHAWYGRGLQIQNPSGNRIWRP